MTYLFFIGVDQDEWIEMRDEIKVLADEYHEV